MQICNSYLDFGQERKIFSGNGIQDKSSDQAQLLTGLCQSPFASTIVLNAALKQSGWVVTYKYWSNTYTRTCVNTCSATMRWGAMCFHLILKRIICSDKGEKLYRKHAHTYMHTHVKVCTRTCHSMIITIKYNNIASPFR